MWFRHCTAVPRKALTSVVSSQALQCSIFPIASLVGCLPSYEHSKPTIVILSLQIVSCLGTRECPSSIFHSLQISINYFQIFKKKLLYSRISFQSLYTAIWQFVSSFWSSDRNVCHNCAMDQQSHTVWFTTIPKGQRQQGYLLTRVQLFMQFI